MLEYGARKIGYTGAHLAHVQSQSFASCASVRVKKCPSFLFPPSPLIMFLSVLIKDVIVQGSEMWHLIFRGPIESCAGLYIYISYIDLIYLYKFCI